MSEEKWLAEHGGALVKMAEQALESRLTEYEGTLPALVSDIKAALASGDRKIAFKQAYALSSRAGTLGWPHISLTAKWLRQALEDDNAAAAGPIPTILAQCLELMLLKGYKGNHPEAQKLVDEACVMLKLKGYALA